MKTKEVNIPVSISWNKIVSLIQAKTGTIFGRTIDCRKFSEEHLFWCVTVICYQFLIDELENHDTSNYLQLNTGRQILPFPLGIQLARLMLKHAEEMANRCMSKEM